MAAPYYYDDIQLDEWAGEATTMGRAHETLARQESTNTFDKLIQASLEDGDGWIHKYLKNEKQQSPIICSDLVVRGLPAHTKTAVRSIFGQCGVITRIDLGKEGKHTAAIHFKDDERRGKALLLNGTQLPDGSSIKVEGLTQRFTTDPMDILEAHSGSWNKKWKAGDPEDFHAAAAAVRKRFAQIAEVGTTAAKKIYPPEVIRSAAKRFKRKTSTGTDHWTFSEILLMPDPVLTSLGQLLSDIQHSGTPPLQMMQTILATLPKKCGGTRTVAIAATLYRLLMELGNEEVTEYESKNAFHGDSATVGPPQSEPPKTGHYELNLNPSKGKRR